jgi:serine/threonine-protein kinase
MSRFKHLIREAHRRSLWQVLLIYIGAAWACFELIATVSDTMGLPAVLPGLAIVLFLLGLPFVVATACVREDVTTRPDGAISGEAGRSADRGRVDGRRRRVLTWRTAGLTFLAALALWGVVTTGWLLFGQKTEPAAVRKSVAVLPFANMSGDPENEYFSDGITDDIITQLSKIADLKVISRTSVMQYKGTQKNIRDIGEELGVATLLEGGVRKVGDRVRINAQLIDAATDDHLWAEQYDRRLTDVFEIQSDIARRIASALQAALTSTEAERIQSAPTDNLDAYDYYLRGRYDFHQRTPDALNRAITSYERAIELDSAYAPAFAGLASVYAVTMLFDYRLVAGPYAAAFRSLDMADAALALDPHLAEAYAARTYIKTFLWVPFEDVASDAQQAIRLEPNSADAHGWYAHLLARERRGDEALREDSIAIGLDPLAPGRRTGFAGNALILDRYELALREADRALALAPDLPVAKATRAIALLVLGRADECVSLQLGPFEGLRALCLHESGEIVEASALVDSLSGTVLAGTFPDSIHGLANPAASIATYYGWIGDAEASLAWFERSVALSPATVIFWGLESDLLVKFPRDAAFWAGIERLRNDLRRRASERR